MAKLEPDMNVFTRAALLLASCGLDSEGLERQRERHRRLASSVVQTRREGALLAVEFAADFDRRLLDELVAVEEACCPFFSFSFDEPTRTLLVGVHDPEAVPAIDVIAAQLSQVTPA